MTMVAEPKKKAKAAVDAPKADKPAVKPGAPGYDWQADYPGEEVFVYTAEDGRTVGMAAMGDKRRPKPGVLRKLRKQPAIEQMWFVIERVCSEAALEVSDDFDDEDYQKMFAEWSEWSNTSSGES